MCGCSLGCLKGWTDRVLCVCAWVINRFGDCWLWSDWLPVFHFLLIHCNGMHTTANEDLIFYACVYVCTYIPRTYTCGMYIHTYMCVHVHVMYLYVRLLGTYLVRTHVECTYIQYVECTYIHTYLCVHVHVMYLYVRLLGAQICRTSAWDVGIGCDSVYPGLRGEPFPWCGGDHRWQTTPTLSGVPRWVIQSAVTTTHLMQKYSLCYLYIVSC